VQYVAQSAFELVKLHFTPLPSVGALIHNSIVWLALVAGAVLAWRRRLGRPHALALGIVAVYLGSSVLLDTQVRYLVPLLPLYAAFAAVPLSALLVKVEQVVRTRAITPRRVQA
jgi:CHASE2 domain-containing sensor protein